ncbi:MAG: carboxymuconolactone decarboxylase family protein [Enterococcus lemanii]|jgi:AhpD family alkylhydroperoxidase
MTARLNYAQIAPDAFKTMLAFEQYIHTTTLEPALLELVKTRSSQINGCAYCLDMHTKDARAKGETEQRLYLLNAWRETDFYTERERVALALTEKMTEVAQTHGISDEEYAEILTHFSEKEFVDLMYAINTINSWNRLAIFTKAEPGHYRPTGK